MNKILIAVVAILALLVTIAGCEATSSVAGGPSIDSIQAELVSGGATGTDTDTVGVQEGMGVRVSISVANFEVVDEIGGTVTPSANETGDGYFIYYMEEIPAGLTLPTTTPAATTPARTTTPAATTTATATPTPTATATATATPSPTTTATVTPTATATATSTQTPTATVTATPTATVTATATATPTPTMTATPTATPGPTMTPTPTATTTPGATICLPFMPGAGARSFATTDTSYTWENLDPGTYIFWVQLVDVDGAPISPTVMAASLLVVPVSEEITTTIPGAATTTPGIATTTPGATTTPTRTTTPAATTTP